MGDCWYHPNQTSLPCPAPAPTSWYPFSFPATVVGLVLLGAKALLARGGLPAGAMTPAENYKRRPAHSPTPTTTRRKKEYVTVMRLHVNGNLSVDALLNTFSFPEVPFIHTFVCRPDMSDLICGCNGCL